MSFATYPIEKKPIEYRVGENSFDIEVVRSKRFGFIESDELTGRNHKVFVSLDSDN